MQGQLLANRCHRTLLARSTGKATKGWATINALQFLGTCYRFPVPHFYRLEGKRKRETHPFCRLRDRLRTQSIIAKIDLSNIASTHTFHPLRGRRFVVLKLRKDSGVETLSLRHTEMGSFAVPREWTDWAPPGTSSGPNTDQRSLLFDAAGALALAELVHALKRNNGS